MMKNNKWTWDLEDHWDNRNIEKYTYFKNVTDIKIKLREMLSKYNNLGKTRNILTTNNNFEKDI